MNDAQWLLEYHALRKKEEQEVEMQGELLKANARILRDTLIGVLGLGMFVPPAMAAKSTDDAPAFIPAAALFSNHHLLKGVLDDLKKSSDVETAMSDDAFEEFSKKLARGDTGDMDPLLLGNLPGGKNITDYFAQQSAKDMLKALGVKVRAPTAATVPHFGKRVKKGGVTVSFEDEEQLLRAGDTLPRHRSTVGPAPVPLAHDAKVQVIELEPGVFGGEE